MVKNFSALVFILLCASGIFAQGVANMRVTGDRSSSFFRSSSFCGYDAGQIGLSDAQGNPITDSVVVLPFGDTLLVSSGGGALFDGDPNTGTDAGIMYLFYECQPTIDSATLVEISADPCRITADSFIIANGPNIARSDSFWVSTDGDRFGNITIINTGVVQTGFNNDLPFQLWLAPATVDNFATRTYEGGANCVDVATDQAFSVIYLNELSVSNTNTNVDGAGCTGSFDITGGLPQFDSTTFYSIDISSSLDPSITGIITNPSLIGAGGTVDFFVPQMGTYDVTVTDDAGSSISFQVDMAGCEAVTFTLPSENRIPGEMFCMPLTVSNFNDIGALNLTFNWDPSIITLNDINNFNPGTDIGTSAFSLNDASTGSLPFAWTPLDLNNVTLADNDTLFNLCFTVIGNLGTTTPVQISPPVIEPNNTVGRIGNDLLQIGFIFNDGQVNLSTDILFTDFLTSGETCNDANTGPSDDGTISVRVSAGVLPYTVTLTPQVGVPSSVTVNQANELVTFDSLDAGDYNVRIEDSNPGTPNFVDTTIAVISAPRIDARVSLLRDISCAGSADGAVIAEINLNNTPVADPINEYTFSWSVPTTENTDTLVNIPVDINGYSVTVTNSDGCEAVSNLFPVFDKNPVEINPINVTTIDASCSGVADGSISLTATGGTTATGDYIYNWEDFQTDTSASTSVTNVAPGNYRLTVTDDNGCQLIDSITVRAVKTLSITETVTDISCNNFGNGTIELAGAALPVFADTLPFTFTWTGTTRQIDTDRSSMADSLLAGDYTVTMRDAIGCEVSETYTIIEPEVLEVAEDSIRGETCPVGMDGFASVEVTGGTGPYTYLWDDPAMQTDSFATALVADTFMVTVTDFNGCIDSLELIVGAQAGPQILSFANDTVSCNGETGTGALSVTAIPGNGNITNYSWSTGTTGPSATDIIGLDPGIYTLTITADDGCITQASAAVLEPAPLAIDSLISNSPLCPDFSNGTLTAFVSGGTMPYTYIWDTDGSRDTTIFNLRPGLAAGSYGLTIVDANNCPPLTSTATVEDPASIIVDFSDIVGVDCFEGSNNGEALATARLSDNAPQLFIIDWTNGPSITDDTSLLATGLRAGDNTVIVTDQAGCSVIDTVNIPSPDSIALAFSPDDPSCNGILDGTISVSVSGGTPGYTFDWPQIGSTQDSVSTLGAGTYVLNLTDANGCPKTDSVTLSEPDPLQLSIDPDQTMDPSCAGFNDGVVAVLVNSTDNINPLGPTPFSWANNVANADTSAARNLEVGTYSVTITDTEGCQDSISFTLNEPTPITFSFQQPADPACFGDATFFMLDAVAGGAGSTLLDYTFSIDNNGLNFPADQTATVFAGTRIITVEDFNGCTASDTIQINEPDELTVNFNPDVVEVELGDTLVRLDPIINSNQIDSFIWSPSEFLSANNIENPIVQPTGNTEFTLNVVDINGCTADGRVLVELNRTRNVYIPNVFSPNGDGRNDEMRIFACKGVRSVNYARVFDRWGSMIFQQDNLGIPDCAGGTILWDGSVNTKDLPQGVYVYVIEVEFVDNVTLVYRGDIAVIR